MPNVGLSGMFELPSLLTYRLIERTLPMAKAEGPQSQISFIRDWYVIVVSYCRFERLTCGELLLNAAQSGFEEDPAILLLAGSVRATDGQLKAAIGFFRSALRIDPAMHEARLRLGRTLIATSQREAGRREVERALEASRHGVDRFTEHFALRTLADLETQAGRRTNAAKLTIEASTVIPFEAPAMNLSKVEDPWRLFRAAQYHRIPSLITALRAFLRSAG
jgi:tetratricopeptide (TPR) repeat protein